MGLLDGGIRDLFGGVFGSFYLDGTLHKATQTDDGQGGMSESIADHAIKYQRNERSDHTRAALKIPERDVFVFMLQYGMTVEPATDDRFTTSDGTFVVVTARQDPAGAYWLVHGTPSSEQE